MPPFGGFNDKYLATAFRCFYILTYLYHATQDSTIYDITVTGDLLLDYSVSASTLRLQNTVTK